MKKYFINLWRRINRALAGKPLTNAQLMEHEDAMEQQRDRNV